MLKRITSFISRDLDYPIFCQRVDLKHPIQYYLDLTHIFDVLPFTNVTFDQDGIAMYDYSAVPPPNNVLGPQYNHTFISLWAISNLQHYLKTGQGNYKQNFLKNAQWLFEHHTVRSGCIVWEAAYNWCLYGAILRSPWVSGMDQGLVISVLVRASLLTGDKRYLELAQRAYPFYQVPIEEGGFRATFSPGYRYFEMYPVYPLSKILDGIIFSLMGLYDLFLTTENNHEVIGLFEDCLRTVRDNLQYWDFRGYWSNFGSLYLSPNVYHKINVCWLQVLYDITKEKEFLTKAKDWTSAYTNKCQHFKVKLCSVFYSRIFMLQGGFKRRKALFGHI